MSTFPFRASVPSTVTSTDALIETPDIRTSTSFVIQINGMIQMTSPDLEQIQGKWRSIRIETLGYHDFVRRGVCGGSFSLEFSHEPVGKLDFPFRPQDECAFFRHGV
jgi:hypothetical protein